MLDHACAEGWRSMNANRSLVAGRMTERYSEPFSEPGGRTTWAVREYVYETDRYLRQVVSCHETRAEAEAEIKEWKS